LIVVEKLYKPGLFGFFKPFSDDHHSVGHIFA